MPERATIFQTVQLGVESTPGTSVAANKKLTGLSIAPAIKIETNKYRALGNKFPTVLVPGKEWVEAPVSGPITYNEIVYLLSSVLAYAAPVQQGGTPAYKWTHAPATAAADTIKTYTIEQGSAERAHKFTYGIARELELVFNRGGCELSGALLGMALQDGITMTAAPTEIALTPVLPTQVDVYLADTQAGLGGASALTRALQASWKISDKVGPVFPLATASGTGFAVHVETEPALECKLLLEADATGMGLLTNLRAGSSKFMRIRAIGALIAATYYYTVQIDAALKVAEVSEFRDEDGIFAIEWSFTGIHDATWGKSTQIEVTNILTAL